MIALQNTKKRKRRLRKRRKPSLRFTPTAWAKLLFLRDAGHTEVGGFGISDPNDLLFVTDFALVRQTTSPITVEFDDVSVADHFDRYIDKGYTPEQVGRIWIHTHPGQSARPSGVDEDTFARCSVTPTGQSCLFWRVEEQPMAVCGTTLVPEAMFG